MKIIVSTSDAYHHILPIFIHLFQKYWGEEFEVEIVGYKHPEMELPNNFTFHSMGVQGAKNEFSNDFKKYIEKQPDFFLWMCEDTFITAVPNFNDLSCAIGLMTYYPENKKICLTNESMKRGHDTAGAFFYVYQDADYRLSSQPAIWRREFLVNSLKSNLTIWQWETQNPKNDGNKIIGFIQNVIHSNEGVRKHDIFNYNFDGIDQETINEMKGLGII